ELRHDLRLGGLPAPNRVPRRRPLVSRVTVDTDGTLPEHVLRDALDVEPGDEYDFFAVRDAVGENEQMLHAQGRLESRVRLRRESEEQTVALHLEVRAGPLVAIVFDGVTPPAHVVKMVRTQWGR